MPHQHVEVSQTGFQGRPHEDHEYLKIHRLNENISADKSHYLMAALGEVHVGEPIPTNYPGPTVVYIVEGEVHIEDGSKPGQVTKLVAGDVLHIDEGSSITGSTPNTAKVFGVSYIPSNLHPENFINKK